MSQEAVPEQEAAHDSPVPAQQGAPKGLLQQMEELMAALNADLTQLDADLQQSASPDGVSGPAATSTGATSTGTRPQSGDEPGRF
ncbi:MULTISPECIES: hypothetical protein [Streptomyces]|uniref:hypothetical protein n=1 Tax=Streptomyces TaxID=1883 RepID=UPI0006EB2F44|nr:MULTISPECIES: hypothetical protein [Streptomyces]MCF3125060.1 hypothetical protein [Streptomyces arenae]